MVDKNPENKKNPIAPDEVMNLVSKYQKKTSMDQGSLQKEIKLLYNLLDAIRNLNLSQELPQLLSDI